MSRFNIGDRVKILCLDDMSSGDMIKYIGQVGVVKAIDEESYGISFENDYYGIPWWFRESSLAFEGRNFLVNMDGILRIITDAREDYPEARNILDEIMYKIGELQCR